MRQSDNRLLTSVFDVYLDRNHLLYVKEKSRPADTYARLFLHVIPGAVRDLPAPRWGYSFDNWDFGQGYWELDDRRCVARAAHISYSAHPHGPVHRGCPRRGRNLSKGEFVMDPSLEKRKAGIDLQEPYEDEGCIV